MFTFRANPVPSFVTMIFSAIASIWASGLGNGGDGSSARSRTSSTVRSVVSSNPSSSISMAQIRSRVLMTRRPMAIIRCSNA
jgi:hypothetical protein